MKPVFLKLVLTAFSLLGLMTSGHALIPEAGNIYYGLARDIFGQILLPESNAQVLMVRGTGASAVVMARAEILPLQSGSSHHNYVLRPSLDDGAGLRYINEAGRINDVVQIMILLDGITYPTASAPGQHPVSDVVPVVGTRATIREVNLRAIDDFDGDGMSDTWEVYWFGTTGFDGTEDFDGDGFSNRDEFLAGTNPFEFNVGLFDPTRFAFSLTGKFGASLVTDWIRESGLNYTMEWTSDLGVPFSLVPAQKLSGPYNNIVDVTGLQRVFVRLKIGL